MRPPPPHSPPSLRPARRPTSVLKIHPMTTQPCKTQVTRHALFAAFRSMWYHPLPCMCFIACLAGLYSTSLACWLRHTRHVLLCNPTMCTALWARSSSAATPRKNTRHAMLWSQATLAAPMGAFVICNPPRESLRPYRMRPHPPVPTH